MSSSGANASGSARSSAPNLTGSSTAIVSQPITTSAAAASQSLTASSSLTTSRPVTASSSLTTSRPITASSSLTTSQALTDSTTGVTEVDTTFTVPIAPTLDIVKAIDTAISSLTREIGKLGTSYTTLFGRPVRTTRELISVSQSAGNTIRAQYNELAKIQNSLRIANTQMKINLGQSYPGNTTSAETLSQVALLKRDRSYPATLRTFFNWIGTNFPEYDLVIGKSFNPQADLDLLQNTIIPLLQSKVAKIPGLVTRLTTLAAGISDSYSIGPRGESYGFYPADMRDDLRLILANFVNKDINRRITAAQLTYDPNSLKSLLNTVLNQINNVQIPEVNKNIEALRTLISNPSGPLASGPRSSGPNVSGPLRGGLRRTTRRRTSRRRAGTRRRRT